MDAKTLCLAVLSGTDASGYEIKKAFEDGPYSHIQDIGFGSIYPALARLLADGLATVTELPQVGKPAKKVYAITTAGRMALLDALEDPTVPDKVRSDFLFRTLFAHLMSAADIERLLADRRAALGDAIARLEARIDRPGSPGQRFVAGYGLAIYKAMAAYIDDHGHELVGAALLGERAVAE